MIDKVQVERIYEILANAEHDIASRSRAQEEARRKVVGPRILYALIGCLALANLYFVNQLTQEIRIIISSMNEMYEHFGRVSKRMRDMEGYVAAMEGDIRLMPIIEEQMDELGAHLSAMRGNVRTMTSSVVDMDRQVGAVNASVFDMSVRFRNLNQNVGQMGYEVDQMARPVP